jgi:hypothetical protein
VPVPEDIYPDDSWVLDIWSDERELSLVVEAALAPTHPCFYSPPNAGEAHAYARMLIRLRGHVQWENGPMRRRASDASGEQDFGDLSGWWTGDDRSEHVDGEWGNVVVRGATQTIEFPSSP